VLFCPGNEHLIGFQSQSDHPSVFFVFVCLFHTAECAFICAAVSALYLRKGPYLLSQLSEFAFRIPDFASTNLSQPLNPADFFNFTV